MKIFLRLVVMVAVILVFVSSASTSKKSGGGGKSNQVAVPRSKGKSGNVMSNSPFGSLLQRAFREIKTSFCSELEALTLQVRFHSLLHP